MGRMRKAIWMAAVGVLFFSFAEQGFSQPVKMIVTHEIALTHWKHPLMEKYCKLVEQRTNGKIKAELYPAGQLYADKAAVAALGTGAVHMTWPVTVNVESLVPAFALMNFPFFLEDDLMLKNPQFKKDLREMLSKLLAPKNVRLLGVVRTSEALCIFRKGITPKKVAQLKGLKLRTTGGLVWLDIFKAMGATAVGMPASEMAAALAQGVIDAIHTSPAGWSQMVGMAAPYALKTPDFYIATYEALVDDKWYRKLPQDVQAVLQGTLDELLAQQWQEGIHQDEKELKLMESKGAKIHTVSPQELKKEWLPLCKPAFENFSKRFPEAYKEAVALKAKYEK